jgi:LuxR family maltose regulon positive regulatory protein
MSVLAKCCLNGMSACPQPSFLAQATSILASLLATAEDKGWGSHVIEILLLQALIEQAQGQRAAAQTTLIRALAVAEPAGYLRLFVDEGEPLRWLIEDCSLGIQETRLRTYLARLLAAVENEKSTLPLLEPGHDIKPPQGQIVNRKSTIVNQIEPLSARELEVLQLVAEGFSNGAIAARLIVSTSTVKTHINHIFGKLGVQSRTQAVAKARVLGL